MNIKKMTAKEIAEMSMEQFNKLTAKEAADALKKVRKSVNQRIRRMNEREDVYSPSVKAIKERGGLKAQHGLNRNETLSELKYGMRFLTSKTSTVTGAKQVQSRIRNDLGIPQTASNTEVAGIYNMFHKLQEEFPTILTEAAGGITYAQNKKRIGRMIRDGLSEKEIRDELEKIYMQNVQNDNNIAESVANEFSNISL